jgi:hypothetical protein
MEDLSRGVEGTRRCLLADALRSFLTKNYNRLKSHRLAEQLAASKHPSWLAPGTYRQKALARLNNHSPGFQSEAKTKDFAMAEKKLDISVDANKFYEQASQDIKALIGGMAVGKAVIFNDTKDSVTFWVYNYIDTVYWVEAMKTPVAPRYYGTVAASGVSFKIHPNKDKNAEFLVSPGQAYIYSGPGAVLNVTPKRT